MRTLLTLLFLLLALPAAQPLSAQDYPKLWKEAQAASDKDLPRTALQWVEKIKNKALAEDNDAQLLRATLMQLQYGGEVCPDTATAQLRRMETALAAETRPAVRALWHSALAQTYLARRSRLRPDTAETSLARRHFEASLAEPRTLAATSYKDYLPLFTAGGASRHYGDDLLHILFAAYRDGLCPDKEETLRRLAEYTYIYKECGRREAALLCETAAAVLRGGDRGEERETDGSSDGGTTGAPRALTARADYRLLTDIARRYEDLPLNVETYILLTQLDGNAADARDNDGNSATDSVLVALARKGISLYAKQPRANILRNFVTSKQQPAASLCADDGAQPYPGASHSVTIRSRNIQRIDLRVFKLWDSVTEEENNSDDWEKSAKRKRCKTPTLTIEPRTLPAYRWQSATATLTAPAAPGVYALELWGDGQLLDHRTLRVTALQPLVLSGTREGRRVVVADRRSGHPVPGAVVTRLSADSDGKWRQSAVYTTGADGTVTIPADGGYRAGRSAFRYTVSTAADKACPAFALGGQTYRPASPLTPAYTSVQLFTDRAIYRPGQRVKFGGVVFTRHGDDYKTQEGYEATVYLHDANGKAADSVAVRSDDLGAFGGELQIPAGGLTGGFLLRADARGNHAYARISVEEYKRPTFTTTTLPVRTSYTLGDTLRVTGEARTFSDVAVSGAKVKWTITRSARPLFRSHTAGGAAALPARGECVTDDEGRFTLPVALTATADERTGTRLAAFVYTVSYTVTAENGETAQGSLTLRAANRSAWIEHDIPARICRERMPALHTYVANAAGEATADTVTYTLLSGNQRVGGGTCGAGNAIPLPEAASLPSGRYALALSAPGAAADTARFVLFSESDTRPADKAETFFQYVRTGAAGDSALVLAGSPESGVLLFYDLVANDSIVESRRISLSDSLAAFRLTYRPEYGDGATAHFCFLRDDKFYHCEASVRRPAPDKRLVLSWSTFRSRLTPGQREEWRLRVTHPDGSPAHASLTARLYDASLDALGAGGGVWTLGGIGFARTLPAAYWRAALPPHTVSLSGSAPAKWLDAPSLRFTQWRGDLFNNYYGGDRLYLASGRVGSLSPRTRLAKTAMFSVSADRAALGSNNILDAESDTEANAAPQAATDRADTKGAAGNNADGTAAPRSNFCETAYFESALRTGADGEAVISFTLPESTTRWRFNALAHTAAMEYAFADTTATARKDFMAVPAPPRFLRQGDRTVIPVTLQNLTERTVAATVELSLTDALTGKSVHTARQKVSVEGGKSVVANFPYTADTQCPVLVCRATATGGGFSDGEEHYLPVLSALTEVTRTLPFSMDRRGTLSLRLDTLFPGKDATHRTLTVELTSNPLWYAVACLPALAGTADGCLSATDWAERLYALCVGEKTGRDNPAIRATLAAAPGETDALARLHAGGLTEDTPWLRAAESEAARTAALRTLFDESAAAAHKHTALARLQALQGTDGAWSWHKGMPGNEAITTDVATLLARIEALTGDRCAHAALSRALAYLKARTAEEVARMKETEKKTKTKLAPGETQLRYLYLRTLTGGKPDADTEFLTERAKLLTKQLTMYGKALTAVVLARAGETAEARLRLQSLLEHTVSTAEGGRWFDTPRAEWSWHAYRIPTQCAAIEALQTAGGDSTAAAGMRRWLLQAKRTQMWETSRATADAVYTLLSPAAAPDNALRLAAGTAPLYYTLYDDKGRITGLNAKSQSRTAETAGYFKLQYAVDDTGTGLPPITRPAALKVRKTDDGLSWGCVYAAATVPAATVAGGGKGLTLTRRFELLLPDGTWAELPAAGTPRTGDRVRQVLTVTADRDYDFVEVETARPACLAPVRALSGYGWDNGLAAYRSVRDNRTQFFIEKVRKGSHTLTEDFFADRTGSYTSGVSTVRCVYAPEFQGTAKSVRINVTQ